MGIRKKGWKEVDKQIYLKSYKNVNRKKSIQIAIKQIEQVEKKGNKYILVASQLVRNRVLGLYGGGKWKYPTLRVQHPACPITEVPFLDKHVLIDKAVKSKENNDDITMKDSENEKNQENNEKTNENDDKTNENQDVGMDDIEENDDNNSSNKKKKKTNKKKQANNKKSTENKKKQENNEKTNENQDVEMEDVEVKEDEELNEEIKKQKEYLEQVLRKKKENEKIYFTNFEFEFLDNKTFSDVQYCSLELVGKSRRLGLQQSIFHTIGKAKLSHCLRKLLHRDALDRHPAFTLEKGKCTFIQYIWIKNLGPSLYQLKDKDHFCPDFNQSSISYVVDVQYHVCCFLETLPDQTVIEKEASSYYRSTIGKNTSYRWGTLLKSLADNGFVSLIQTYIDDKPISCVQLKKNVIDEFGRSLISSTLKISPYQFNSSNNELNQSENNENNDSDDENINLPIGIDTLRYLYQLIEDSGTDGVTQPQLQKLTNISAKYLLKQNAILVKNYGVCSIPQHVGKQIIYTLYTKENYDEKMSNIQNIADTDKMSQIICNFTGGGKVKQQKNTTTTNNEENDDDSKVVVEEDQENQIKNQESSNEKHVQNTTPTKSPNRTKRITLQRLQRKQRIYDLVLSKKITTFTSFFSYLRSYSDTRINPDKKSVLKLIDELLVENKIKKLSILIPYLSSTKRVTCYSIPSLQPTDECYIEFVKQIEENQLEYHHIPSNNTISSSQNSPNERPLLENLNIRSLRLKPKQISSEILSGSKFGYITSFYQRVKLFHIHLLSIIEERKKDENFNKEKLYYFKFSELFKTMSFFTYCQIIGVTHFIPDIENLFDCKICNLHEDIIRDLYRRRTYAKKIQNLLQCLFEFKLARKEKVFDSLYTVINPSVKIWNSLLDPPEITEFHFTSNEIINSFWFCCKKIAFNESIIKSEIKEEENQLKDKQQQQQQVEENSIQEIEKEKEQEKTQENNQKKPNNDNFHILPSNTDDIVVFRFIPNALLSHHWSNTCINNVTFSKRQVIEKKGILNSPREIYLLANELQLRPQQLIEYYDQMKIHGTLIRTPHRKKSKRPIKRRNTPIHRLSKNSSNPNLLPRSKNILQKPDNYDTDYEFDRLEPPPTHFEFVHDTIDSSSKNSAKRTDSNYLSSYAELIIKEYSQKFDLDYVINNISTILLPSKQKNSFWRKLYHSTNSTDVTTLRKPERAFERVEKRIKKLLLHSKHRLTLSVQIYDKITSLKEKEEEEKILTLPESYEKNNNKAAGGGSSSSDFLFSSFTNMEELHNNYEICQTYFPEDNNHLRLSDPSLDSVDSIALWEIIQQIVVYPYDHHIEYYYKLQQKIIEADKNKDKNDNPVREIIKFLIDKLINQEITFRITKPLQIVPSRSNKFEMMYYFVTESLYEVLHKNPDSIYYSRPFSPQFFYCMQFLQSKLSISIFDDYDEIHRKLYQNYEANSIISGASVASLLNLHINNKISLDIKVIDENLNKVGYLSTKRFGVIKIPCKISAIPSYINLYNDPLLRCNEFSNIPLYDFSIYDDDDDGNNKQINNNNKTNDNDDMDIDSSSSMNNDKHTSKSIAIEPDFISCNNNRPRSKEKINFEKKNNNDVSSPLGKRNMITSNQDFDDSDTEEDDVHLVSSNSLQKNKNKSNSSNPPNKKQKIHSTEPPIEIEIDTDDSILSDNKNNILSLEDGIKILENHFEKLNDFHKICNEIFISNTKSIYEIIYNQNSKGISMISLQENQNPFDNLIEFSHSIQILHNIKLIVSLYNFDEIIYVSREFLNDDDWFTFSNEGKEVFMSPWIRESSLNRIFLRGANARILRFVIHSPGISLVCSFILFYCFLIFTYFVFF